MLCPKHHDVIDADEEAYTVERLIKMKKVAEISNPIDNISDEIALQFIESITIENSVLSNSQSGGQTAQTINNYYPEKNSTSYRKPDSNLLQQIEHQLNDLISEFPNHPIVYIDIEANNQNRQKTGKLLELILSKYNIAPIRNDNYFCRNDSRPVVVLYNPKNFEFIKKLNESIKPLIQNNFILDTNNTFALDSVKIFINGIPRYHNNGSVIFE